MFPECKRKVRVLLKTEPSIITQAQDVEQICLCPPSSYFTLTNNSLHEDSDFRNLSIVSYIYILKSNNTTSSI